MSITTINRMSSDDFKLAVERCCGASRWIDQMALRRPFASEQAFYDAADDVWFSLSEPDWLEAFTHHPKIGDIGSLKSKFASTAAMAGQEQSGTASATVETLQKLKESNDAYEKKFGFIFIVCATGKTASQMLGLLQERLNGSRLVELHQAVVEQARITGLRLRKLMSNLEGV